jgi:serine phosphatase RsbU (regulator of sigma subunit)
MDKNADVEGPEYLDLSLRRKVQEVQVDGEILTQFGYELTNFSARYEIEPENLGSVEETEFNLFAYFFIGSAIVLSILVFTVGLRNIFLGKVEWRRALFILFVLMLGYLGWRSIFYWSVYGDFIGTTAAIQINLNNLLTSLLVGFYGAMAYISWEAFARSQRNGQVELVDTLWQKRFFVRENGLALINGFAVGGILLGAFSIMLMVQDSFFVQSDSQFGTAEAAINAKLLTINMSAWSTTWLIGFAQIGFVYGFCKHWIKQDWGALVFAIFFSSIFLTVLGRLVGTPGSFFDDLIIFVVLGTVVVVTYQRFGIITSNTAWWLFVSVILVLPYLNSPNISLALVSWIQGGIHLAILFFAFVAYKYGISVSEVGNYIPEYQARLAQQMRVEKEIEIARDSQYQLMPINPPKAEGLDVYGFFLPSFEVGGDYFDYVLSKDDDGNATALTMTVVDVSGKAMRAAMPAVFTSGLLLAKMKSEMPDAILSDVAEPIYNRTDKRTFITCAIARYDLMDNQMVVANAGHCKPILKRNGAADFIQTPDPKLPLGFKPDVEYGAHSFKMKKGDVFLLYSDGLPEAENEQGERFGFDEVPRLLEEIDTEILTAQEIAHEIKRTVQTYSNFKLADDTTVICLKV